jgi:uncharacterized protein YkwD
MHPRLTSVCRALAAAFVALAALFATLGSATAATACTPEAGWGTNRPDLATQALALVNQHRAGLGLGPLTPIPSLQAAAEWKSLHMAGYHYFSHDDPGPPAARSAFARIAACGYAGGGAGENIAYGYRTAQSVVTGWLNSPGHRANIENGSYRSTGIGAGVDRSGTVFWTQEFGTSAATAAPAPAKAGARTSGAIGARPVATTRFLGGGLGVAKTAVVTLAGDRPVTAGSVRCRARVDGKPLRVLANTFTDAGLAKCAWWVPEDATGKVVRGSIGVRVGSALAVRVFIRRVG